MLQLPAAAISRWDHTQPAAAAAAAARNGALQADCWTHPIWGEGVAWQVVACLVNVCQQHVQEVAAAAGSPWRCRCFEEFFVFAWCAKNRRQQLSRGWGCTTGTGVGCIAAQVRTLQARQQQALRGGWWSVQAGKGLCRTQVVAVQVLVLHSLEHDSRQWLCSCLGTGGWGWGWGCLLRCLTVCLAPPAGCASQAAHACMCCL
jgi:hypothetical protein